MFFFQLFSKIYISSLINETVELINSNNKVFFLNYTLYNYHICIYSLIKH